MARLACAELFDPAEVAILHVMGRVVRRCFLLGNDPIGPCASQSGKRCSDKGFISMSTLDYLELLDATARIMRADEAGATSMDRPPIFERLKLDVMNWKLLVKDFGRVFSLVAGTPQDVYELRSLISKRRFHLKRHECHVASAS